jgi:outer membrane protein OmpA-like peptidoglycan-associated protein
MHQPHEVQSQLLLGENLPAWFAFVLALFGIIACLIAAQLIVPKSLQTEVVLPWVVELIEPSKEKELIQFTTKANTLDLNLNSDAEKPQEIQTTTKLIVTEHSSSSSCPPLFSFTFLESSMNPLAFDKDQKINQLKDWLDLHPHQTVILEGYSDSTGSKDANLMLSYKRAESTKNILIKKGIPNEQLSVSAFGEEHLLDGIPSTSEKNRRVSMRIEGLLECQYYSDN